MTGLLALVWALGTIASIVFIVRPKKNWPPFANRKRSVGMLFAIFLGIPIVIGLTGVDADAPSSAGGSKTSPRSLAAPTPEEVAAAAAKEEEAELSDMRRNPENYLELVKTSASKDGFDIVFMLRGTIKNTGQIDYKDPVIECRIFSKTDTPLGKVRQTLYEAVPAGKTVPFRELNMGFVQSEWELYSCGVVGGALIGS